jgi:hypothetical protein
MPAMPTMTPTDWAHGFASSFNEAVEGNADFGGLLDWAYDLYPKLGHLDPKRVALDELMAQRD